MSSSPFKSASGISIEGITEMEKVSVSPVTDLALNMKSLTTSFIGTPSRRISWSNPFPLNNNLKDLTDEYSPSTDSPTFQEYSCKVKKLRQSRKVLHSDSDDEKENIARKHNLDSRFSFSKQQSEQDAFENDSQDSGYSSISGKDFQDNGYCMSVKDSQDSGYSSLSVKRFEINSRGATSRTKFKSAIFTDDSNDSFENLIHMEEIDDNEKILPLPDVTNLLTKPLYTDMEFETTPSNVDVKNGRPPIRRCLCMEMECHTNDPSEIDHGLKTTTFIAAPSGELNESNIDFESSKRCPFKRPDPPNTYFPVQSKRRKSSPSVNLSKDILDENDFIHKRSYSETAATIMHAVLKADLQPDLIGDCSKSYILPLVNGRHQDLKSISPQTLVQVINGNFNDEIQRYTLVDCRYPYEFEGGHIKGAKNIFNKDEILETFLKEEPVPIKGRSVLIFHCEFSSERAPNLSRFLRNKDREVNDYPKLYHPEIYLVEGGYKAFFAEFKEYCEPQSYMPMNHQDHSYELREFRAKSKSWGNDSKSRYKIKATTVKEII